VKKGGNAVKTIMNDDILGRLVAYEKYVQRYFRQAARARRRGRNAGAVQEYRQIKELRNHVSVLVDLAFDHYGMQKGLTKTVSIEPDSVLHEDLDSLVVQLCWPAPERHISPPKREFALVS
jgi:hypothetical protein